MGLSISWLGQGQDTGELDGVMAKNAKLPLVESDEEGEKYRFLQRSMALKGRRQ